MYETMEGRISNTALRNLCIENDWFTAGDAEQYKKLFYMNDMRAPIDQIATVIWLCSDEEKHCRGDIIFELQEAGFTEQRDTRKILEEAMEKLNERLTDISNGLSVGGQYDMADEDFDRFYSRAREIKQCADVAFYIRAALEKLDD